MSRYATVLRNIGMVPKRIASRSPWTAGTCSVAGGRRSPSSSPVAPSGRASPPAKAPPALCCPGATDGATPGAFDQPFLDLAFPGAGLRPFPERDQFVGFRVEQGDITIQGNGSTIQRSAAPGTPPFRLFYVSGGLPG